MGPPPPPKAQPSKTVTDSTFLEKLHAVEEELAVCMKPYQVTRGPAGRTKLQVVTGSIPVIQAQLTFRVIIDYNTICPVEDQMCLNMCSCQMRKVIGHSSFSAAVRVRGQCGSDGVPDSIQASST